jgi:hypothetical protein
MAGRGPRSTGTAAGSIFTDDAEYHDNPFGTPLVGHNACGHTCWTRRRRNETSSTVERRRSRTTILGVSRSQAGQRPVVRMAGSSRQRTADGRASRFREWTVHAPETAG